jgi:hypothetical protein
MNRIVDHGAKVVWTLTEGTVPREELEPPGNHWENPKWEEVEAGCRALLGLDSRGRLSLHDHRQK